MRQVYIYRDETGAYCAEVPSLPGCFSCGDSRMEAIAHIREAIALYEESLTAHGKPIPNDDSDPFLIAV